MADPADVMIFVPGNERFQYIAGGRDDEGQRIADGDTLMVRLPRECIFIYPGTVSRE